MLEGLSFGWGTGGGSKQGLTLDWVLLETEAILMGYLKKSYLQVGEDGMRIKL